MSDTLAVCPHCGARRAQVAPQAWSKDEIRALLVTDPSTRDAGPSGGVLQTLVLPHPSTHGAARFVELALTAISLPLVVVGTMGAALIGRRHMRGALNAGGELAPVVAMTIAGACCLGLVSLPVIAVPVAALWLRAAIRLRAAGSRSREPSRVEPSRPAKLPEARALGAAPVHVPATPEPEPAPGPGAEPRLLR